MPDNSLAVRETPLGLEPNMKEKLQTWEDYLSFYTQLTENSNAFSWIKADLMAALQEKFGDTSTEKFATDIGEPRSTIDSYVRVSKAFPMDTRDLRLSFSHHYQASFADKFDDKKGEFVGNSRFDWVARAADDKMSTRELQRQIHDKKEEQLGDGKPPTCEFCNQDGTSVHEYVMWAPREHTASLRFNLHDSCVTEIVNYIRAGQNGGRQS